MNRIIRNTLLAALLSVVLPAQAAIQQLSFNGAMDSGFHNNQSFSGGFSFDDATLTGSGLELLNVNTLNMSFLSTTYTQADSSLAPDVAFQDGVFLGLEWTVEQPQLQFTFVSGASNTSEAFIAYDTPLGNSGAGSVIYAPVPEPEAYALLLVGFGMIGFIARRRKNEQA